MHAIAMLLGPWSSFFATVGTSAAALIGLMFVVISFIMQNQSGTSTSEGLSAFSTPIVVHLSAALLVSVALCAPWPRLGWVASLLAATAFTGAVYIVRVARIALRLARYTLDAEDWIWYNIVPFCGYGVLLGGAALLAVYPRVGLFLIAGAVAVLVFTGIRNAWDLVTFIATRNNE